MVKSYFLNLSLFDAAGATGAGPASTGAASDPASGGSTDPAKGDNAAAAAEPEVIYGKPPAEEAKGQSGASEKREGEGEGQVDFDAEFDKLIKGDFKDAYNTRIQKTLSERFKRADATEKQYAAAQKVLDAAALRYGLDPNDTDALIKAFDKDKSWLTQKAMQNGVSEEMQLEIEKGQRAQAELGRLRQQSQLQANLNGWMEEGSALQATYPGLDVLAEINNPETGKKFLNTLRAGNSVEDAYFLVHKDKILGGAMQYTAQKATEKVTNDIKARGLRPTENGASGAASARVYKSDPSSWDDKDIDRVRKEAQSGKRIIL